MAYQDNEIVKNPDDPWQRQWGTGSVIASLVAVVIMASIVAYGAILL
jgi:hypothetical protein